MRRPGLAVEVTVKATGLLVTTPLALVAVSV